MEHKSRFPLYFVFLQAIEPNHLRNGFMYCNCCVSNYQLKAWFMGDLIESLEIEDPSHLVQFEDGDYSFLDIYVSQFAAAQRGVTDKIR